MTLGSRSLLGYWCRLPLLSIALSALLFEGRSAFAASEPVDPTTRTAARELATQGAEAFERGDFSLAYDRLTRAFALFPAPTISIMQARTLARLGRLVEALDRYEETRRMPVPDDATEAFRAAIRDAATEAEQLRTRTPRLHVQVQGTSSALPDAVVTLDGRVLPPALIGVDCPVDPGSHIVAVRSKGVIVYYREVSVTEQQRFILDIGLEELKPAVPSGNASRPVSPISRENTQSEMGERSDRRWLGWGAFGGATLSAIGSTISGIAALRKKDYLDVRCDPACEAGSRPDIKAFRTYRTTSYVTGGLSIALASAGTYLLLSEPKPTRKISVGFGATAVSLSGRF